MTEFSPTYGIISPFAGCATNLYIVYNTKMNSFFVLAKDKSDALSILVHYKHVTSRKLARIGLARDSSWAPEMQKFFASAAQAESKGAQGIVSNMGGFAVMSNNGSVYMPLNVVS